MRAGLSRPAWLLATVLGTGSSPVMPGTCGSIAAIAPCLLLPGRIYPWTLAAGVLLATGACVHLSRKLDPDQADPGWFVLDEAAGVWLAALPAAPGETAWMLTALVLFRVFDILKPPPLRALERVSGGWGIVLDDLGAGAYALGLSWGLKLLIT